MAKKKKKVAKKIMKKAATKAPAVKKKAKKKAAVKQAAKPARELVKDERGTLLDAVRRHEMTLIVPGVIIEHLCLLCDAAQKPGFPATEYDEHGLGALRQYLLNCRDRHFEREAAKFSARKKPLCDECGLHEPSVLETPPGKHTMTAICADCAMLRLKHDAAAEADADAMLPDAEPPVSDAELLDD